MFANRPDMPHKGDQHGRRAAAAEFTNDQRSAAYDVPPSIRLYTRDELIRILRLDTMQLRDPARTIRGYHDAGLLTGIRLSRRLVYRLSDIEAFLDRLAARQKGGTLPPCPPASGSQGRA